MISNANVEDPMKYVTRQEMRRTMMKSTMQGRRIMVTIVMDLMIGNIDEY